jgi:peptidoglycan/LPS O-acetylase OafA/YrhL
MSAEIGGIDAASSAGAPQTDRRSASQRIDQLDVLRGIAALSVVLYHMCCSLPLLHTYLFCTVFDVWRGRSDCAVVSLLLSSTPLRTLVAGPEAVVLFFVLSGFVLSLPFIKGRGPRYGDYVILRFFRIYIPAAVSIGIAAFIVNMLRPGVLSESDWVSSFWQQPVQPGALLANLAMLDGALDIPPFNIVMWSLVEELRISLLLPFLVADVALPARRISSASGDPVGDRLFRNEGELHPMGARPLSCTNRLLHPRVRCRHRSLPSLGGWTDP